MYDPLIIVENENTTGEFYNGILFKIKNCLTI